MKSKKPIAELDPVEKSDTTCECSEWLTQSTFVPLYLCMYVRVFAHARTHAGMHTGTHTARARAEANCYKRKSNLANFPLRHNITALDLFMVRRHLLKVERILVSNIQVPGLQKKERECVHEAYRNNQSRRCLLGAAPSDDARRPGGSADRPLERSIDNAGLRLLRGYRNSQRDVFTQRK